jgi:hypothetical protein
MPLVFGENDVEFLVQDYRLGGGRTHVNSQMYFRVQKRASFHQAIQILLDTKEK